MAAAVASVSRIPTPQAARCGTSANATAGKWRGSATSKACAVITSPTNSRIAAADSFGTIASTSPISPVTHTSVIATPFRIE